MGILEAITGTRVYLDTNIFIYAVEGYAEFQDLLNELFEAFDNRNLKPITNVFTLLGAKYFFEGMIDFGIDKIHGGFY